MKNYTTPRTLADSEFVVGYRGEKEKSTGIWYGVYLTTCAVAVLTLVFISANGA